MRRSYKRFVTTLLSCEVLSPWEERPSSGGALGRAPWEQGRWAEWRPEGRPGRMKLEVHSAHIPSNSPPPMADPAPPEPLLGPEQEVRGADSSEVRGADSPSPKSRGARMSLEVPLDHILGNSPKIGRCAREPEASRSWPFYSEVPAVVAWRPHPPEVPPLEVPAVVAWRPHPLEGPPLEVPESVEQP